MVRETEDKCLEKGGPGQVGASGEGCLGVGGPGWRVWKGEVGEKSKPK